MSSAKINSLYETALSSYRAGRPAEALAKFERLLAMAPDLAAAHVDRALMLRDLKRLDEALVSVDKAIALQVDFANAWSIRSAVLWDMMRLDEALASIDKVLALNSGSYKAWTNRCAVLHRMNRLDEALASADKAIALNRNYPDAWNNRAIVLRDLRRLVEALASVDKAISLYPNNADAWNNRGLVLRHRKRLEEALSSLDRAVALNPNFAGAWHNRANTLAELKRPEEALGSYARAVALDPDAEFLFGDYLLAKTATCNWDGLDGEIDRLASNIRAARKTTYPFPLLSLLDDPGLQKMAATVFSESLYPGNADLGPIRSGGGSKIKVGYYSSDFHCHATTYLMIELLEAHDAGRFELFGFSYGPDLRDEMRGRVTAAFDNFVDVRGKSDREVAFLSRQYGLHIAVDLKGYTHDARPGIFAEGCAPIQVHYLGYPGTLGANNIDYLIADRTVIPPDSLCNYREKIVWLPDSYQANDSRRKISDKTVTRQEAGLPSSGFVFCCFNNNYKIHPEAFDCWMRILKTIEGSVLWLLEDNAGAANNLRKEADKRGVDAARLIFAGRVPADEHLARQGLADLFLDTWPCNGHTTVSDALWGGLPVLTLVGKSFASRVAASLLNAVGMSDLVASSREDYGALAVDLARQPGKLAAFRKALEDNRSAAPLFDGSLTARHLEAGYEAMVERHLSGLPPDNIEIDHCTEAAARLRA